jgi:hypothetical protein
MLSYKKSLSELYIFAQNIFDKLRPDCIAIYMGGSFVDNIIDSAHDYDFIIFINAATSFEFFSKCSIIRRKIKAFANNNSKFNIISSTRYVKNTIIDAFDLIQIRNINKACLTGNQLSF